LSRLEAARLEVAFRIGPYRRLRRVAPGRLLDVGCGRGGLTERFVRLGWSAAGVEPSEHAAAQARLRGVDVHVGVLDDAPWARETFDVVLFNHSLEHIPDPVGALRNAAKLLKPGGHIGIAVPNFGSWQRRAFGSDWFHLDVPRHLQHFDAATLPDVVGRVGLEVVEVRTMSMSAGLQASLQYRLFGRPRLNGAAWRLAAWATLPLIAVADRLGQGDCVSVVARRPGI
jgi:SAM-dependent methyltransferase